MEIKGQAHHLFTGKPGLSKPATKAQAPKTGNESGVIVADLVTTEFSQAVCCTPPVIPQGQQNRPATEVPPMARPLPQFDLASSSGLQSLNNGNLSASPTVIAAVPYDTPEIRWLTDVLDRSPKSEMIVPSVPADTPEIQWLTQGTGLQTEEPILAELVATPEEPILAEVVRYTDPDLPEIEYLTEWLTKP